VSVTRFSGKKIYRLGDRLPFGRFLLHGRYAHAINLLDRRGRLLSLVDGHAGAGPNHIEVHSSLLAATKEVVFDGETLSINGERYALHNMPSYNSGLTAYSFSSPLILKNLTFIIDHIKASVTSPVCRYILIPDDKPSFGSALQCMVADELKSGLNHLQQSIRNGSSCSHGVELLCGLGYGLTPSGDDILAGVLAALYIFKFICGIDREGIKNEILLRSHITGLVSKTLLAYTSEGRFYMRHRRFMQALVSTDYSEAKKAMRAVGEYGASSGEDFLTGFALAAESLSRCTPENIQRKEAVYEGPS
jgi:hypothetical protein